MTFVPLEQGARAVVRFTHGSETFSNVFHFTKGNFTTSDMEDLAAAVQLAASANLKYALSPQVSLVKTEVYDVRTSTGAVVENTAGAGAGGGSGDTVPINTALVVTIYSATRGRAGRGRVFVAGLPESLMDNGVFNSGAITLGEEYVDNVMSRAASAGWTLVVRSAQLDKTPLNPAVGRPIVSVVCRNGVPGTQRRRVDRL